MQCVAAHLKQQTDVYGVKKQLKKKKKVEYGWSRQLALKQFCTIGNIPHKQIFE